MGLVDILIYILGLAAAFIAGSWCGIQFIKDKEFRDEEWVFVPALGRLVKVSQLPFLEEAARQDQAQESHQP